MRSRSCLLSCDQRYVVILRLSDEGREAPEVKLLGRPGYADLLSAAQQAERHAGPHQCPVAVVKKKRAEDLDGLVVFRLETFWEWFV